VRYQDTLAWLYGLEAARGMDFRLERLGPVLERLDHPEAAFASIHVAGTNGKGSTAAMLHSIYTTAGYTTGLYTSPHLLSFRERVRVGRDRIAESDVVRWVDVVRDAMDRTGVELTFFEITTVVAFLEFRARDVDLAVVETGLGGRLDATNVVRTAAAVITSIGLDHEQYLGDTVAQIAAEKAGILRSNAPLVTGDLPDEALAVVARRVAETGSRWLCFGKDFGPSQLVGRPGGATLESTVLLGEHQQRNAGVAIAVTSVLADAFALAPSAVERGILTTRWPGRLEIFDRGPRVIVDAAHNPEAAGCLRTALEALALRAPRVLVFGVLADKDWREMLCRLVPAFDHVVLVPVENARALDPRAARDLVEGLRPCTVAASPSDGLRLAERFARDGTIVVTGSIFLVAEVYRLCGGAEDPFAV
jgi:dihydrofolate synthase/folylpolyglutamate synthase